MKLVPLKAYRTPAYPTQDILRQHPELLRVVPSRWRSNKAVLGVLAGLLALMEQSATAADDAVAAQVPPLFLHGTGRGAFGCIAVNPPVFLSEEEARAVIEEECNKAGIDMSGRDHAIRSVRLPVTDSRPVFDEKQKKAATTTTGDLQLDGWDAKRKIGYEFVSEKDFIDWESKDTMGSTLSDYNVLDVAQLLRKGLEAKKTEGTVAVFYEPAGTPDRKVPWKKYEAAGKEAGRAELRKQVQDFLAWLKAQGTI